MLYISIKNQVKVQNGGFFISRGKGFHPERVIKSWELIFVQSGTLAIREGETEFRVQAGETLILWPDRKHKGTERFAANLKFYWLHFEYSPCATAGATSSATTVPQYTKIRDPERFIALFRFLLNEQESGTYTGSLELFLLLLLQQVADAGTNTSEPNRAGAALAYKARQLIGTRFEAPLTTAAIAGLLHCNADYLGRVFRMTFRTTLTEALHRQRILAAEKLLLSDECTIDDIAERVGFHDSGYFRRLFKRQKGVSPLAYKKLYQKEHINSD